MALGALGLMLREIDEFCGARGKPYPPIPDIPRPREVLVGVAVSRLAATLDGSAVKEELVRLSLNLVASGVESAGFGPTPPQLTR